MKKYLCAHVHLSGGRGTEGERIFLLSFFFILFLKFKSKLVEYNVIMISGMN